MSKSINNILAIETTGKLATVALSSNGNDISEVKASGELNHLTELIPLIQRILGETMPVETAQGETAGVSLTGFAPQTFGECHAALDALDAIAVSAGPGSFTGIRIGISTVRAIAQVTGLPVIKVPTLETFVYQFDAGKIICPVFDARRSQMYAGAYFGSETLVPGGAYAPEEFLAELKRVPVLNSNSAGASAAEASTEASAAEASAAGTSAAADSAKLAEPAPEIIFCGDGLGAYAQIIEEQMAGACHSFRTKLQSATSVLRWAAERGVPADYRTLEPIYMRQAEAQRKLDERLAAEKENRLRVDGDPEVRGDDDVRSRRSDGSGVRGDDDVRSQRSDGPGASKDDSMGVCRGEKEAKPGE
jgi:tRNA threonylcarbamoyl adenosine modification protein YeaZ